MTDLRRLQESFQSAVVGGDPAFEHEIRGTGRVSAQERVSIYSDAYRLRLIEVLRDNYPGLAGLLGNRAFDGLARAYIDTQPSTFRSVRWYGDRLADFAGVHLSGVDAQMAYEMARIDWQMSLAFDAADAEPATEADMGSFTPDQWPHLVFDFHPSLGRLDLHYDLFARRSGDHAAGDAPAEPLPHPTPWLIWRQDLAVRYRSMPIDEAWALDAARAGEPFAVLCGGITEWIDEGNAPLRIAGFLKRWLLDGLILRVRSSQDRTNR